MNIKSGKAREVQGLSCINKILKQSSLQMFCRHVKFERGAEFFRNGRLIAQRISGATTKEAEGEGRAGGLRVEQTFCWTQVILQILSNSPMGGLYASDLCTKSVCTILTLTSACQVKNPRLSLENSTYSATKQCR